MYIYIYIHICIYVRVTFVYDYACFVWCTGMLFQALFALLIISDLRFDTARVVFFAPAWWLIHYNVLTLK